MVEQFHAGDRVSIDAGELRGSGERSSRVSAFHSHIAAAVPSLKSTEPRNRWESTTTWSASTTAKSWRSTKIGLPRRPEEDHPLTGVA